MVVDVIRSAAWSRNWVLLLVLVAAILATVLATATQAIVPWVVYPAL